MKKAKTLTVTELVERISVLKVNETLDFATACVYLERDLDKVSEGDLTNWYGIKKVKEFDQEIALIGGYGGGDSYAISYKWDNEPNEEFEHELEVVFNKIDAYCGGFTGIYVFEEV